MSPEIILVFWQKPECNFEKKLTTGDIFVHGLKSDPKFACI